MLPPSWVLVYNLFFGGGPWTRGAPLRPPSGLVRFGEAVGGVGLRWAPLAPTLYSLVLTLWSVLACLGCKKKKKCRFFLLKPCVLSFF